MTSCPITLTESKAPNPEHAPEEPPRPVWLEPSPLPSPAQPCTPSPSPPRLDVTDAPHPPQGLFSTPYGTLIPLQTLPICTTDLVI